MMKTYKPYIRNNLSVINDAVRTRMIIKVIPESNDSTVNLVLKLNFSWFIINLQTNKMN